MPNLKQAALRLVDIACKEKSGEVFELRCLQFCEKENLDPSAVMHEVNNLSDSEVDAIRKSNGLE